MHTPAEENTDQHGTQRSGWSVRALAWLVASVGAICATPVVSAHSGGTHVYVGGVHVTQWHASIVLLAGVALTVVAASVPRLFGRRHTHYELVGVLVGLAVAVLGAIGLVQLSPIQWYQTQPLVPRSLHDPLMLALGFTIAVASLAGGRLRWPDRPRYAGLGIAGGLWVAYPGLLPDGAELDHPIGYLIALALPLAVGYVLWRDARGLLSQLFADRPARWFGIGVALLGVVFFSFSSGMASIVPDSGVGLSLTESTVSTLPVAGPLVTWPAVEVWFPRVPFTGMVSIGTVLLLGMFGGLMGLNGALFAFGHRRSSSGSTSRATTGVVGIAAPQACCCCGPVLSQVALVALGPSVAAPIYLLFADPSSSIGSLFLVGSVAILTGTVVRAARTTPGQCESDRSTDARLARTRS